MTLSTTRRVATAFLMFVATTVVASCGGGGAAEAAADAVSVGSQSGSHSQSASSAPAHTAGTVTSVTVSNPGASQETGVPVTFGQVFVPGDVGASEGLVVTLDDGTPVPSQIDVKARNADGSIRHAIVSVDLPKLSAGESQALKLARTTAPLSAAGGLSPVSLLAAGFSASVSVNIGGTVYSASADQLLQSGTYQSWLSGPLVNEWLVSAPLKTAGGIAHPHLSARFAIRSFTGLDKARVDVTVENDWAYEPSPQNYTYDAQVFVGGKQVYGKAGLTHFAQARWHKQFWWGVAPVVDIRHDVGYLLGSRALPNYDQSISVSSAGLSKLAQQWDDEAAVGNADPMGAGIVYLAMPATGGRGDIAPLPQWAAMYLLSMDANAKKITLGVGDLAGSWPIHYRDKTAGRPVSLVDHPYMTLLGHASDTYNPVTKQSDAFPACGGDCSATAYNLASHSMQPYQPDSSHEPSLAYLPYLVTGDHYYLEELQFWANWNMLRANPGYRGNEKGLVSWDQVRGQAWSLRTLAQTAYITPDDDPMKKYFVDRVGYNLDHYNQDFTNANPNQLGVLDGSGLHNFQSIAYKIPTSGSVQTGLAPWQDDFFTWAVGYTADLGFTDAQPLLVWKAKFPVGRMTAPGYCWIDGAAYALAVRPTATAPLYTTLAQAYQATMVAPDGSTWVNSTGAKYLDQPCGSQAQADWRTQLDHDNHVTRGPWLKGEMSGYATSIEGFPSNMQPALAVAATSGVANAQQAWDIFINRPVKPDYSSAPQWAIVPRK